MVSYKFEVPDRLTSQQSGATTICYTPAGAASREVFGNELEKIGPVANFLKLIPEDLPGKTLEWHGESVRKIPRDRIVVVAAFVGLVVLVVTLLKPADSVAVVSLHAVHYDTERYEGKRVEVSGTVRVFQDTGAPYYVLEDAEQNRILLRASAQVLAPRVGSALTAVGVVGFDDTTGIYLDVQSVADSQ